MAEPSNVSIDSSKYFNKHGWPLEGVEIPEDFPRPPRARCGGPSRCKGCGMGHKPAGARG